MENEVAWADDEHINIDHGAAKGDVAVLGDHGGNDVGACRAAIVGEHDAQAYATQRSANYHTHEWLLRHNWLLEERHHDAEQQCGNGGANDGADDKLLAHRLESYSQQDGIDYIVSDSHVPFKPEIQQRRETCHTASDDFLRQKKCRISKTVA